MIGNFAYINILIVISIAIYYSTVKTVFKNIQLLVTSLVFYVLLEGDKIIILAIIILVSFVASRYLTKSKYKRNILLFVVAINVLILLLHKYILVAIPCRSTSLPIGLSFFTFQSISYLVDVYRKKSDAKYSFVETATFIAFFPKLLAGPLERIDLFILEMNKKKSYNGKRIFTAFKIIIFALVCKFVFADKIGVYVDSSLSDYNSLSSIKILTIAAFYSFQIFFDFYAYSILAIGIARLYGIKLSYNFNYPYFSSSLYDFWKRWNITLTSWFRDYIYIPLGGNKVSTLRWMANILIVFTISGIWHGATFNFLLWGFLHGLFYISERYVYKYLPDNLNKNSLLKILYTCTVFILLSLLWLIFKVDNFHVLSELLGRLFSEYTWDVNYNMAIWFVVITLLMQLFRYYRIVERYIFTDRKSTRLNSSH